jgi:deoxyribonucleoside regulator
MANATFRSASGEAGAPSRRDLLIRVAKLYYYEGFSQGEIAGKIGVSRSNVSKMLQACKDLRIVEIRIDETSSTGLYLESELARRLDLLPVTVVHSFADPEETKTRLGQAAARHLEGALKDGLSVGISWGSSLYRMVEAFSPPRLYQVDVVQLMGGLGARDLSIDGTNLAYRLCGKLNGQCHIMPAPLFVRSKTMRDSLLNEPDIRRTLRLALELDIAFVGIGSNYPGANALVRSGYLSKGESGQLLRLGVVGNVLGRQIDVRGNLCPVALNDRVVGLDPAELKRIPLVVGVAAGAPKAEAILGAVRGKYINALVTDEAAGLGILRLLERPEGSGQGPGHGRARRSGSVRAAGSSRGKSARAGRQEVA